MREILNVKVLNLQKVQQSSESLQKQKHSQLIINLHRVLFNKLPLGVEWRFPDLKSVSRSLVLMIPVSCVFTALFTAATSGDLSVVKSNTHTHTQTHTDTHRHTKINRNKSFKPVWPVCIQLQRLKQFLICLISSSWFVSFLKSLQRHLIFNLDSSLFLQKCTKVQLNTTKPQLKASSRVFTSSSSERLCSSRCSWSLFFPPPDVGVCASGHQPVGSRLRRLLSAAHRGSEGTHGPGQLHPAARWERAGPSSGLDPLTVRRVLSLLIIYTKLCIQYNTL